MLLSPERDPQVEFVAEQLKRVGWISSHLYLESEGYRLDWLPQGGHRMTLLQVALKNSRTEIPGLDRLRTDDAESHRAITDFWNACLDHLSLSGQADAIPAFVRIIESWQPRS